VFLRIRAAIDLSIFCRLASLLQSAEPRILAIFFISQQLWGLSAFQPAWLSLRNTKQTLATLPASPDQPAYPFTP